MRILDYAEQTPEEQARWRREIAGVDWRAAVYLLKLLERGGFYTKLGPDARLLLGTEGDALAAFCTLADRDCVGAPELHPWVGFVYTAPAFRGQRRSQAMIDHACALAAKQGCRNIYLTTREEGLYEKYGFVFLRRMEDEWGEETKVYVRMLQ